MLRVWATALFMCLIAACGSGSNVGGSSAGAPQPEVVPTAQSRAQLVEQLQDLGVDRFVGIRPATFYTEGAWSVARYGPSEGAACMDGGPYLASVRVADAANDNVVLFLQGGGACWNADTCAGLPLAKQTANVPGGRHGIFDREDSRNPLQDWHFVFASYCDGSVFSGDAVIQYGNRTVRHWGLRNLSAAVTRMKNRFPNPDRILVAGSSAGGYGTLMASMLVRTQYPEHQIVVMNDSGPYLENPDLRDEMGVEVREHWQFEQFLPDDCVACSQQLIQFVPYILARDERIRWGLFSYRDDLVIGSLFLQLGERYPVLLDRETAAVHELYPERFKRFFVDGIAHTILGQEKMFVVRQRDQAFATWLRALIEDTSEWIDQG